MRKAVFSIFLLLLLGSLPVQAGHDTLAVHKVYLLHGHGSDARIFQDLELGHAYQKVYVNLPVPEKRVRMDEYARSLTDEIDTSESFALIGVSLGGMLCTELSATLHPEVTIIISSAKSRSELPARYRFLKYVPLYRIVPAGLLKLGSYIAQPMFEPDRKRNKDTFKAMLKAKDAKFIKNGIHMIVTWDRLEAPEVVHIHGSNDHTLPIRRVKPDYTISGGSHMMTLTEADTISHRVIDILDQHFTD